MFTKIRSLFRFLIAFFITSVLLVLLMDKVVMPLYVAQGKSITLQDVTNVSLSRAQSKLHEMGLEGVVLDSVAAPGLPAYTVVEQQPLPGKLVKKGRAIFLTISRGKEYVQMPNLIGKAMQEAQLELDRLNLEIRSAGYEYDPDKPKGVICRQSISPGVAVAKGSALKIWISNGPPVKVYTVPDLFGVSLSTAKRMIRESGLKLGEVNYIPNKDLTPLTVISQSPQKGTEVFEIITVDLEVTTSD